MAILKNAQHPPPCTVLQTPVLEASVNSVLKRGQYPEGATVPDMTVGIHNHITS